MDTKEIINISDCEFLWKEKLPKRVCNNGNLNCDCNSNLNCYFKQLKRKEQECEKYKKGFEEDFAFNNELINDKLQIGLEINRYKQTLDEIENFLKTIMETNRVYPLQANLQKVLKIINKAKGGVNGNT